MKCEILVDPLMYKPGRDMLDAMYRSSPMLIVRNQRYLGQSDLLMVYGMGHVGRRPWIDKHLSSGRHMVGFDLGYWMRGGETDRAMRMTIDQDHPQAWLDDRPAERFDSSGVKLREDYDPNGPIVLVGLGPKTNTALAQPWLTWERDALKRIRAAYPRAEVIFRPKREDGTTLPGTSKMAGMPIEQVLKGASLVVCRHSNVAVDACIAGIPVVCWDGAASALYGNELAFPVRPTLEQRLRFLRNLAWFQWRPSEAAQCWQFLLSRIEERDRVAA